MSEFTFLAMPFLIQPESVPRIIAASALRSVGGGGAAAELLASAEAESFLAHPPATKETSTVTPRILVRFCMVTHSIVNDLLRMSGGTLRGPCQTTSL